MTLKNFKFRFDLDGCNSILQNHHVHNKPMLPGVTWLNILAQALHGINCDPTQFTLKNIVFKSPLILERDDKTAVEIMFDASSNSFEVTSAQGQISHCVGQIVAEKMELLSDMDDGAPKLDALQRPLKEVYDFAQTVGIKHGEWMQGNGTAYLEEKRVVADISLSKEAQLSKNKFLLHPAIFDSATIVPFASRGLSQPTDGSFIPLMIKAFRARKLSFDSVRAIARQTPDQISNEDIFHNDLLFVDENGELLCEISQLSAKRIRGADEFDHEPNSAPQSLVQPQKDQMLNVNTENWLNQFLNRNTDLDGKLDVEIGFYELGLNSAQLLELSGKLGDEIGISLHPTLLYEHNTIGKLANWLAEQGFAIGREEPESASDFRYEEWLCEFIHGEFKLAKKPSLSQGFYEIGLDSSQLLTLSSYLEDKLNCKLHPTICYEQNTIEKLAQYLDNMGAFDALSDEKNVPTHEDQEVEILDENLSVLLNQYELNWLQMDKPDAEINMSKAMDYVELQREHDPIATLNQREENVQIVWKPENLSVAELLDEAIRLGKILLGSLTPIHLTVFGIDKNAGQMLVPFFRSLTREFSLLTARVISGSIKSKIPDFGKVQSGVEWINCDDNNFALQNLALLKNVSESDLNAELSNSYEFSNEGAVVISGGKGAIGLALVEELMAMGCTKFSLIGRNEPSKQSRSKIEKLQSMGAEIQLLEADVVNFQSILKAWKKVKNRFERVSGVIHAAGFADDSLLRNKSSEIAQRVLAVKMDALKHLDILSAEERLEFFVAVGSTTGLVGNLGQTDYAFANGSMIAYIKNRQKNPARTGLNICMNWPYWKDGGFQIEEDRLEQLQKETGIAPLETRAAQLIFRSAICAHKETASTIFPTILSEAEKFERFISRTGIGFAHSFEADKTSRPNREESVDKIAIIGLAGEYPKARTNEELWSLLVNGVDGITEIPSDRWNHDTVYRKERSLGSVYAKHGGFIENHDHFDAEFFNIPPEEARLLDPQERKFLEVAWRTIETAAINPLCLKGSNTGVYVGVMWGQYQLQPQDKTGRRAASIYASVANRVSYSLDFVGPSMAVDSMCSSSLTALHLAVESLKRGECEMAIAGGVNLMSNVQKYQFLCQNHMLSSNGRCNSFGEDGDGYVPGEGVGAVLLKPYQKAIEDGDPILAVVSASALSHGGRGAGMTVPNPEAQAKIIKKAHEQAKTNGKVGYIEAHGTGTSLGDPIEISGLMKALSKTQKEQCYIGSVKSNFGHLEGAAGIASIAKTILQMQNNTIVSSLHCERLNPKLNLKDDFFTIARENYRWKQDEKISGISAFGAGGSNAHIVLEAHSYETERNENHDNALLVISSKNVKNLRQYVRDWIDYLKSDFARNHCFADIAATSISSRPSHEERLAIIASGSEEAQEILENWLARNEDDDVEANIVLGKNSDCIFAQKALDYIADGTVSTSEHRRVTIPAYPFVGEKFWIEPNQDLVIQSTDRSIDGYFLQGHVETEDGSVWSADWSIKDELIEQHKFNNDPILPAALMLQTAHAAAKHSFGNFANGLAEAKIGRTIPVDENVSLKIETFANAKTKYVEISSSKAMQISFQAKISNAEPRNEMNRNVPTGEMLETYSLYDAFAQQGLSYGPIYRSLRNYYIVKSGEIWAELDLGKLPEHTRGVIAIDGAMQCAAICLGDISKDEANWLPASFENVEWYGNLSAARYVRCKRIEGNVDQRVFELSVLDADGQCVWSVERFYLDKVVGASKSAKSDVPRECVQTEMVSDRSELQAKFKKHLAEILSKQTGLSTDVILAKNDFSKLGVDSVIVMNVTNILEEFVGPIAKTVFFDYPSVNALCEHLLESYLPEISKLLGGETTKNIVKNEPADGQSECRLEKQALTSVKPRKKHGTKEPLAIIGLALRAPGARNLDEFWLNLRNGANSVTEVPTDRWPVNLFSEKCSSKINYCKYGGFIDKPYEFDAEFFEMTPADTMASDPAERLFLETAWLAAEDAGYTRKSLRETKVGVYVASMWQQHQLTAAQDAITGSANANLSILSSVANRVSGALGLSGPSISLDTMCSGSLTALHLAATAIYQGECDAAIVGGVNLSLHPSKFAALSQRGFLSQKGHCAAFGADADGYVPAEAVVSILVKPLSKALEDKDPIYATVLGSAVNHVGTSNGSTVPSSKSQAEALRNAIERAEISAGMISYVEAHGTGTALGDPIELNGLEQVLGKSDNTQPIKIGSVKSNIGHAEGAAGLIGLAKVLLQFKHETLVPTLHIEKINPEINFEKSSLEPVFQCEDWRPGETKYATVSSFGAGGSNGCVVLQSYSPETDGEPIDRATIVKLSAHKADLLHRCAQALSAKLKSSKEVFDIESVAATLHRGREDQSHRLAVIAENIDELCFKLEAFVQGVDQEGVFFTDAVERGGFSEFFADMDGQDYLASLISSRNLKKLAKLWVSEIEIDWNDFYSPSQYLSLPASTFARTDFAPETEWYELAYKIENISDFDAQKYEVTIPAFHPILAHHFIDGRAQLSMAGVGQIAEKVLERCQGFNRSGFTVQMHRPYFVEKSLNLEAEIHLIGDEFLVELWSDEQKIAEVSTATHSHDSTELSEFSGPEEGASSFYDSFKSDGYIYGDAYRAIDKIKTCARGTIATLKPFRREYSLLESGLDVGQIDSAMQLTRVQLSKISDDAWLPTAFHICDIDDLKGAQYVACLEMNSSDRHVHFNTYWLDGDYTVLGSARLTMTKVIKRLETEKLGRFMRQWVEEDAKKLAAEPETATIRIPAKADKGWEEILTAEFYNADSLALIFEYKDENDVRLFDLWKLVNDAKKNHIKSLTIGIVASELSPHLAGLTSWLSALQEELPSYRGSVLITDRDLSAETILADAKRAQTLFKYHQGKKFVQGLKRADGLANTAIEIQGQSFLITGGAGGLGQLIARHLANKFSANLILTGRSPMSEKIEAQIADLRAIGSEAIYVQADITDQQHVDRLRKIIGRRYGSLFGIIHAAGANDDRWITDQSFEQITRVIAPKVDGIRNLSELAQNLNTELVMGVSSISGFLGNPGQSDYSYANAYMDYYLDAEMGQNCRTVSVCWPLWKGIGMQISPEMAEAMRKSYGLEPLPQAEGILAFEQAILQAEGRILCTFGDQAKIQNWLEGREILVGKLPTSEPQLAGVASPSEKIARLVASKTICAPNALEYAKKLVAESLKETIQMEESAINWTKSTNAFGLSSVASAQIISVLEAHVGALPKTLMFECENMQDLANYIADKKLISSAVTSQASDEAPAEPEPSGEIPIETKKDEAKARNSRHRRDYRRRNGAVSKDIAIIGAACKFPSADSMPEFWDVIANGKDAITPIPEERWDKDRYPIDAPKDALRGGFINGIKNFDNEFFGLYHGEALAMDPQERLALQTTWHSLEDAGIRPSELSGKPVGVYVGAMWNQYQLIAENSLQNDQNAVAASSSFSSFSNRISYLLNLHGPSLTLDTMCSSSLMAVKLAVDALRAGEIETAIVAGVNASVHPYKYYQLNYSKFLSPEGRCGAFGEGGDGYVPSEGIGVIVLRRLSDAKACKNKIRGVIKGIGVSHGGRANGFTVPRPQQQAMAINSAIADGGIDASSVSYIEAHGTGTSLGDPIEVRGLKMSYGQNAEFSAAMGSVKSNIGHAESASGMASIFKVLLQFEHGQLAPTIHCETLNPKLELDGSGLTISQTLADWNSQGNARRAGISSFGAGGTNVHLIMEEGENAAKAMDEPESEEQIVVLSAANYERLVELVKLYVEELDGSDIPLSSIAVATQIAREPMESRLACIAHTREQLLETLSQWLLVGKAANVWFTKRHGNSNPKMISPKRSELGQLASDWVCGDDVSWAELWDLLPRFADLPQYPFEEKPIWYEDSPILETSADQVQLLREAKENAQEAKVNGDSTLEKVVLLLADIFKFDPEDLDPKTSFDRFGMESVSAKLCSDRLTEVFGINVQPTWFYNYPNTELLVEAIHKAIGSPAPKTRAKLTTKNPRGKADGNKIAIIGVSGAFAGASDAEVFGKNLRAGLNSVKEVPSYRWDVDACYSSDPSAPNKSISRKLGVIEEADKFDPVAFHLLPDEALGMDPQQRLFMKHSAQAVDSAGISYDEIYGSNCGVFAGAMTSSYRTLLANCNAQSSALSMLGNHSAVLPARVAYWLNLKGPSMCVDTACSSSLVAIDLACKAIANGECETALAGGVFVCATSDEFVSSSQAGMLSPEGQCKTFDDEANGIAMGEGVGVVLLKPLSAAIADGDPIQAVIRATGTNQDGKSNGITAPNLSSQETLIKSVMDKAQLHPNEIDYFECHGTGTKLGDPVEIGAIANALGAQRDDCLPIGSVKPNVGHCYAAAGMAGLFKCLCVLNTGVVPPSIGLNKPNSLINFDESGVRVVQENWELPSKPSHICGLSAFGYSGTNAHIILESAPKEKEEVTPRAQAYFMPLSARKAALVVSQAKSIAKFLRDNPRPIERIACTLQNGRRHEKYRAGVVVSNLEEFRAWLSALELDDIKFVKANQGEAIFGSEEKNLQAFLAGKRFASAFAADAKRASIPGKAFDEKIYWPDVQPKPTQVQFNTMDRLPRAEGLISQKPSKSDCRIAKLKSVDLEAFKALVAN